MNAERSELTVEYRGYILRKVAFIAVALLVIIVVSGAALTIGGRDIGFGEAYEIIIRHISGNIPEQGTEAFYDDYAVWNVRLPRVIVGIIAGAGLAVGGAAMQSAVKNPLADPYTTGISSGAVFGVSIGIVLGFSLTTSIGMYGLVLNAFVFGIIPALVIVVISRLTRTSPATLILVGVAMSYLFNSASTLLLVGTSAEKLQDAYLWQIGTLENVTWDYVPIMLIVTVIGTAVLIAAASKINLLTAGDESAKSLGIDPEMFRTAVIVVLSLMTAVIVGFLGIIGFVGLVSPHIVRTIIGADNRYVIPGSAVFGAAFLLIGDLIARTIIYPGSLPVGVVMSFVGAPIFLYLVVRARREMWRCRRIYSQTESHSSRHTRDTLSGKSC
ncbi:MAG: iron ABC transporter permease [Candidatus Methanomethylophilus sp.]|jgi:iron complex transport system permease protein|nr:iron ABC transporter permease [Methanomethylophilus sp.]MCI2093761.1 iron ABC transporter permease [Methanomethylophilus sp.]